MIGSAMEASCNWQGLRHKISVLCCDLLCCCCSSRHVMLSLREVLMGLNLQVALAEPQTQP